MLLSQHFTENILALFRHVLTSACFSVGGQSCELTDGVALDFPLSPVIFPPAEIATNVTPLRKFFLHHAILYFICFWWGLRRGVGQVSNEAPYPPRPLANTSASFSRAVECKDTIQFSDGCWQV